MSRNDAGRSAPPRSRTFMDPAIRRTRAARNSGPPPRGDQVPAELPVHLDIRAAETVDRLLRIPHDEEASGGVDGPENLRLQGVRVLELVHENVPEPLPEPPRDRGIPRQKSARPQQQDHEVQPAPP